MTLACCWYLSQSLLSRILADFGGCHQIVGPKQIAPMKVPLKREKLTPARERALFATGWLTSHKGRGVGCNSERGGWLLCADTFAPAHAPFVCTPISLVQPKSKQIILADDHPSFFSQICGAVKVQLN